MDTTATTLDYKIDYGQKEETFEELVNEYMLLSKKTLAELLALKRLNKCKETPWNEPYQPFSTYPSVPPYPSFPWLTCENTGGKCNNPFHDCIHNNNSQNEYTNRI